MTNKTIIGALCSLMLVAGACGGEKKQDKPAKPATAEPAEPAVAKPAADKPNPVPEKTAQADTAGPVDGKGLQLNAVPGQSLVGKDGVAQFSGSGDQQACVDYATKLVPIFSEFQGKIEGYSGRFAASPDGISAMREAATYIQGVLPKMIAIEPAAGTPLFQAHAAMTVSLNNLATELSTLAGALEAGDQPKVAESANSVQKAGVDFQAAFQELLKICGE